MAKTKKQSKVVAVNTEYKGLGALPNPYDERDISLAQVQAPVALPKKYQTDISKLIRRDQKQTGTCVGQAGAGAVDFFNLIEQGKLAGASARGLYALCKHRDGLKESGTYPRILAKVLTEIGAPTSKTVKEDFTLSEAQLVDVPETQELLEDAYPFRVDTNYAWVNEASTDALMQAIYQNKVILASLFVGKDYSDGRMTPVNGRGRHYILLYGFEVKSNGDVKFLFLNSWDEDWGKDGCGYFLWSEMKGFIYDVLAFVDIPNELLQKAKTTFKFTKTLTPGMSDPDVTELQKRLAQETAADGKPCFRYPSFTAFYGSETQKAVQRYQILKGIIVGQNPEIVASPSVVKNTGFGQVGTLTRGSLNGSVPVKIGLYPKVAEKRDQLVAIMQAVGYPVVVTDEYRTFEQQDALYAQGRTKPGSVVTNAKGGESLHNYRCAFDVAFKKGTGVSYDGDFAMLGTVGKILGLEWGGDWASFVDKPHFQFTAGYSLADFQQGKIDESVFGVVSKVAEQNLFSSILNMSFVHRLKSAAITLGSIVFTAIVTVAVTNPGALADVLTVVQQYVASWGLPSAFTVFIMLVVNELVRAFLNARKIAKASRAGLSAASASRTAQAIELY